MVAVWLGCTGRCAHSCLLLSPLYVQLNDEEEAGQLVMEGQPGIGVDPYNLGYEDAYGAGYEFDDATDAAAAEDFQAERAMQAGVQHSLMRFMSDALGQNSGGSQNNADNHGQGVGAGAGVGPGASEGAGEGQDAPAAAPASQKKDNPSPPLPPLPGQSALLPPKVAGTGCSGGGGSPASGPQSHKSVLVNPITGKAHAVGGTGSDRGSPQESQHPQQEQEGAGEWQCSTCGGSNVDVDSSSGHTCALCGCAR